MPSGLNAEPGALADWPGRLGWSSQDWLGWPALATEPALSVNPIASMDVSAMRFIRPPPWRLWTPAPDSSAPRGWISRISNFQDVTSQEQPAKRAPRKAQSAGNE